MAKATPKAVEKPTTETTAKVEERPVAYVVYIGGAGSRTIHDWQWRQAGIESQEPRTVQWDKTNGFRVPKATLDFLTTYEFDQYIRGDGKFAVLDG